MSAKGLDKNSIIGLVLIGAILLVFTYLTQPTAEELAAKKQKEALEKQKTEQPVPSPETANTIEEKSAVLSADSTYSATENNSFDSSKDSLGNLQLLADFGPFVSAAQGEEQTFTIENEHLIATISNKGGRITSVELKEFVTYDSLPLILFNKDSSRFNIELAIPGSTGGNSLRIINTENLFFETTNSSFEVMGQDAKNITLRLYTNDKKSYVEYIYALAGNSYLVDFDFNIVGFENVLLEAPLLKWEMFTPSQEKTIKNQEMASTTYYKYNKDEVDYIGYGSYKKEELISAIDWVMFKQQYFNSTLIAKDIPFERPNSFVETIQIKDEVNRNYIKQMRAGVTIPFANTNNEKFAMQFYFGPNKIETLKEIGIGLDKSIDYGWGIFGWVNHLIVRPVFNFLMGFNMSVGIVILLLTIIIKMLLFPITWKTYLSSAKMKVLKPEITELTEKYKNDAMKKQQETMALYRKTGVNPLAGCIPMLIQMPILFALFRFFPATFDLRQKSFLWAEDLSSYDSILELPFDIPFYGAHVSLFTLLMAISMIFYTKANSQMTAGAGMEGAMAAQMKIMMYLMPVMMLFFFNSYASGLSYYYLIANMITIGQQAAIKKWFINEDKLLAKIQENKTKVRKKSGFGAKLEARMKDAQKLQQQRKKK
ncbi:MAG: membrane protein insertase YidC [Flavobacteriales bacterium CG18_big_fil_WC_8_21_14_2_50_32_9]|nr:MAG: membrane protein insertase YidC [Flavobacteriales bacterium CG18_big_fil_WC_8_21_14_2_50_32_9]